MMSTDRESLQEFLEHIADKYYGAELVERLEALELITVWDVIAAFEDQIVEAKAELEDGS